MRSQISSRILRVPSSFSSHAPVTFAGSSKGQCNCVVTPGKIGQALASDSLQTVITNGNNFADLNKSNTLCVLFAEISMSISRRTLITNGFKTPGSRPAVCLKKIPANLVEYRRRHLAPCTVVDTNEKNTCFHEYF